MSRFVRPVLATATATALVTVWGAATGVVGADAAAGPSKGAVLSSWTQTSASSFAQWNGARKNQEAWAALDFDWSTDYCSSSPDEPLGFDFRLPCHRHDFGYRNYKAVGGFDGAKNRIDDAFLADMERACDTYGSAVRPACDALAQTYYKAVVAFGKTTVSQADLDRAARIKAESLAAAS